MFFERETVGEISGGLAQRAASGDGLALAHRATTGAGCHNVRCGGKGEPEKGNREPHRERVAAAAGELDGDGFSC
jgi:hypothetical protein